MKRIISVLLVVLLLFSAAPLTAFAADALVIEDGKIELTPEQLADDPAAVIENALLLAKENATAQNPVTVHIPSGKYLMSKCLHIYSNTTLLLEQDTVLVRTFTNNNLLKAGLKSEVNAGYNGYVNMKIIGGVWDCHFSGTSCGMRFAHCNHVTLQNVTIKNNKNSHHMELAGSNDFNIIDCTFTGYQRTNSADGEAIQIDILHNETHFPSYREFDDTPCKNITVRGCTFDNVFAGVGTRSGVIGSYFENIRIVNNTFKNVMDKAICAFNYRNSVIENNTIDGSTIGIIFEYYPASNLTGKLYMPNNNKASTAIQQNSGCKIRYNKIKVNNRTRRSNASGIAVYGGRMNAQTAKSTGLKSGNYDVGNMIISDNTITAGAEACGIRLQYVHHTHIQKNTVTSTAAGRSGYHALLMNGAYSNRVYANTFSHFYNGIYAVNGSKWNNFIGNTITNNAAFALAADNTSGGTVENNNRYYGNKGRFSVAGKAFAGVAVPTPKAVKNKKKKRITVTWKKVGGVTAYAVYRSTKPNGGYQYVKTIKNSKKPTFNDTKVRMNQKYYYKIMPVRTVNATTVKYAVSKAGAVK